MLRRRHLSRLNRKRSFGCLFFSSVRGRSRRPWPSFPSSISSALCLLPLSRLWRMSVLRRLASAELISL